MAEIAQCARLAAAARERCQQEIKQRSERLRGLAKYRSISDTVPAAESLSATVDGSKVLGDDDLWEIYPRAAALSAASPSPSWKT